MSKLDDVKGELPKIERTYQLDPETAITVREDGTWFEGTKKTQKGDRAHVVRLARSKIILDGMLNPIDSDEDRGLRILIDGRAYTMTREGLATGPEVLKWLTSRGALINPAESTNMLRYIHESELRDIDAYTMNGWQRNGAFVVGDRVLRGEGFVLTTQATRTEYSARGSFEEWQQEVLERAKAKPGWLFLILIGLSSPLLARLGIETGTAFNCFAKSSTGKTAGLKAAAGVWGRPDAQGCLKSFNMTLAAVEGVAQGGNGVGLFLDELRTASKSVLKEFAYAFGNGVGRERMKSNAEMRKVRYWLCNAAMSSEKTVEGIFAEMDEAQAGGMILRLIDQDMNSFLPHIGAEDVRAFEDAVARCYGSRGLSSFAA